MLARNEGKTAAELEITQAERAALVKVAARLRSGEVPWHQEGRVYRGFAFTMRTWGFKHACGSVGCIAYMAYEIDGVFDKVASGRPGSYNSLPESLLRLFCPSGSRDRSPAETADAIDSYLLTGDPQWEH